MPRLKKLEQELSCLRIRSKQLNLRVNRWLKKLLKRLNLSSRNSEKLQSNRGNLLKRKEFRRQFKQRLLWQLLNSKRRKLLRRLPLMLRLNVNSQNRKKKRKQLPENVKKKRKDNNALRKRLKHKKNLQKNKLNLKRRDSKRKRNKKSSERKSSRRRPVKLNSLMKKLDMNCLTHRKKKN